MKVKFSVQQDGRKFMMFVPEVDMEALAMKEFAKNVQVNGMEVRVQKAGENNYFMFVEKPASPGAKVPVEPKKEPKEEKK